MSQNKLECLSWPAFSAHLMFASKARAYPKSGAPEWANALAYIVQPLTIKGSTVVEESHRQPKIKGLSQYRLLMFH